MRGGKKYSRKRGDKSLEEMRIPTENLSYILVMAYTPDARQRTLTSNYSTCRY